MPPPQLSRGGRWRASANERGIPPQGLPPRSVTPGLVRATQVDSEPGRGEGYGGTLLAGFGLGIYETGREGKQVGSATGFKDIADYKRTTGDWSFSEGCPQGQLSENLLVIVVVVLICFCC